MPQISVIIPAYNASKTIKETVESVLNQTFSDFELIVINDGSTDSTSEIISTIKDERLKVFSYPNTGVAASRNRGVSQALGEYISFLDADDLWTPDKLETQLKALQENPPAAVAYSWTDWIDEFGQFLRPGGHFTENGDVYVKLLLKDFIESGSNPLIRRQALTEVGGFDESLAFAEDWDLWLRLAAQYSFVAIPSPQILYRISPNSASFNVWKMELGSLRVIDKALAEAPASIQHLKREILANRYKYLTLKATEGNLERRRGLVAARFLLQAIRNDLAWLQRTQLMLIILFKIAMATLLPTQQAHAVRTSVKKILRRDRNIQSQN
ncbi:MULTISPECIES: glycosyltransferase [unclassified Coleofasciculus]|uniref:glycosyltransferase n=1 Tax=unclassified Coleofasciculus TaxID=2692782 RepID=UPI00187DFA0F|nr:MULTISPECIES: glycosyltransferase [unclassified Coleofasciculus]MBE9126713.1 glycosyltransferase [Coleofasciculus sp. LEGE 07081]MBE9150073.1 glycosyltransferase [Coleofasciculus sp. LEGE 07092]